MQHSIALAGFFLSGFAALVYEICWIRTASLVFGSTTYAVSTVLAVFFAGMAIGSHWFARRSERTARPLFWFGVLELTVGASALATPFGFALAEEAYGWAYRSAGGSGVLLTAMRVLLVGAIVLVPTIAMGGTLPMVCRYFVRQPHQIARTVGAVYALNTFGAALGCLVCGTVLIPTIGVERAIQVAVAINLVVGLVVIQLSRSTAVMPPADMPDSRPTGRRKRDKSQAVEQPASRAVVYALFFLVGLVALANEVLWTRYLGLLVRTTVYTYTITLTVVLAGIAVGSLLASRWFDHSQRKAFWFGLVQVALGLVVLTTLFLPQGAWESLSGSELWRCGWLLAPAALLSGLAFPLAVRIVTSDPQQAGPNAGRLAAINTGGGIIGSLVMGFVALPLVGLQVCVMVSSGLSLLGGFAAWLLMDRPERRGWRMALIATAAALWLGIPPWLGTKLPADFLAAPDRLIDYREGLASNVAVVRGDESMNLEIDRWWQAADTKGHQILAAHLPMLFRSDAENVLVVGGGAGQTLSRFLMYGVDSLDCVEIEPAVFDVVADHFDAAWMEDPRVRIVTEDGRNYLTHTARQYDVISLELGQVFRPGVASFYTADFYHCARQRLTSDGILCQFVPVPFFRLDEFRSVLRTFRQEFPNCYLWYNTAELLLIGTLQPLTIDAAEAEAAWSREAVQEDLAFSHWGGPDQWLRRLPVALSCFLAGPEEIAQMSAEGEVYRDDRPQLEYRVSHVRATEVNEVAVVQLLRQHLAKVSIIYRGPLSASELEEINQLRETNLADMIASAFLRGLESLKAAGDYAAIVKVLATALEENPDNVRSNRLMGEALVKLGRLRDARRYLEHAAAIDGENPLVQHALAVALHRSNKPREAIEHYRLALVGRPDDAELYNNIGAALAQLGDFEAAIDQFRQALAIEPGYADAQRNLNRALGAAGSTRPAPPPEPAQ
jgi:spermidine synthase